MFDRKKYKSFAKQQLKNRWGVVILVILLTTVVSLLFDIPRMIQSFSDFDFQEYTNLILEEPGSAYRYLMQTVYGSNSYLLTFVQSFVSIILSVAAINVYLKMSRSPEKVSLSVFFEGLNNWWRAILAYLWNFLWVFLWTMLFIIPGIVKSYAYSQIYYIIVEHPGISITKAMKISMIIGRFCTTEYRRFLNHFREIPAGSDFFGGISLSDLQGRLKYNGIYLKEQLIKPAT